MNEGNFPGFSAGRPVELYLPEIIHEETLQANGAFDIQGIPPLYSELRIQLQLRGSVSSNSDAVRMYLNGDTTLTNYRRLVLGWADNGAPWGYAADDNYILECPAATSTAGDFSESEVVITGPMETTKNKTIKSFSVARRSSSLSAGEISVVNWESTASIKSIQIRTDNHPTDLFVAGSSVRLLGWRRFRLQP